MCFKTFYGENHQWEFKPVFWMLCRLAHWAWSPMEWHWLNRKWKGKARGRLVFQEPGSASIQPFSRRPIIPFVTCFITVSSGETLFPRCHPILCPYPITQSTADPRGGLWQRRGLVFPSGGLATEDGVGGAPHGTMSERSSWVTGQAFYLKAKAVFVSRASCHLL